MTAAAAPTLARLGVIVDATGARREVRLTVDDLKALADGGKEAKQVLRDMIPKEIVPSQTAPSVNRVSDAIRRMQEEARRSDAAKFADDMRRLDPFANGAAPPVNRVAEAIRRTQEAAAQRDAAKFADDMAKLDPFAGRATTAVNRYTDSIRRMREAAQQAADGRFANEFQKVEQRAQAAAGATTRLAEAQGRMQMSARAREAADFASQIERLDPFQQSAAASAGRVADNVKRAGGGLNGLREPLTSATRALLGLNPAASQVSSALGNFAIGAGPMIAILAGVAALAYAWDKVSANAKAAAAQQDQALTSLNTVRDSGRNPIFGELPHQKELAFQKLQDLQQELAKSEALVAQYGEDRLALFLNNARKPQELNNEITNVKNLIDWTDKAIARMKVLENEPARLGQVEADNNARQIKILDDRVNHRRDEYQLAIATNDAELRAQQSQIRERFRQIDVDGKVKALTDEQAAAQARLLEQARTMSILKGEDLRQQQEINLQTATANRLTQSDNPALRLRGRLELIELERVAEIRKMGDVEGATMAAEDRKRDLYRETFKFVTDGMTATFEGVATRGIASFQTLFDSARQMATRFFAELASKRLIDRYGASMAGMFGVGMNGNSPNPTLGMAGLGVGIAGFGSGYAVGSMTPHQSVGALSGAAAGATAGAMIGSAIPIIGTFTGALIGGLAGAAGGFLGAGNAAKKAAEETRKLRDAFELSFGQYRLEINGQATDLTRSIAQIQEQHRAYDAQIEAAYAGKKAESERNALLAESAELERKAIETAKARIAQENEWQKQELSTRLLRATGFSAEADIVALAVTQQREYAEAVRAGKDATFLALLAQTQQAEAERAATERARQQREALEDLNVRRATALGLDQNMIDTMNDTIRAQREYEQAVRDGRDATYLATLAETQKAEATARAITKAQAAIAGFDQTLGGLKAFKDQLALSDEAGLSPTAKLAEARRQYDAIVEAAHAGDQSAAGRIPAAAQAFLAADRIVNASGAAFQRDLDRVNADTDALIKQFEGAKSIYEKQLDELMKIRQVQQDSYSLQTQAMDANPWRPRLPGLLGLSADETSANFQATVTVLQAGFLELAEKLDTVNQKLETVASETRNGFEGVSLSK